MKNVVQSPEYGKPPIFHPGADAPFQSTQTANRELPTPALCSRYVPPFPGLMVGVRTAGTKHRAGQQRGRAELAQPQPGAGAPSTSLFPMGGEEHPQWAQGSPCCASASPHPSAEQGELPQERAIPRRPGQPFCMLTQRRNSSEGRGRETWLAQVLGLPKAHGPTVPDSMKEVSPPDKGGGGEVL